MRHSALFEDFACRSLKLRNRIVMAPMTRYFCPGGVPTRAVADYYRRRAAGGAGLIITEGTSVDRPAARNHPDIPRFHGSDALRAWGEVRAAVHDAGGSIAPQLWHVGAAPDIVDKAEMPTPAESPSGVYGPGVARGGIMSGRDIENTIAAFAAAARDAQRLGFDCIELHAAHGYLFDQFLWQPTNSRKDRYGGATIAERNRFGLEVVKAIRATVGGDFAIIMRVSQWKAQDFHARIAATPAELEQWLVPLAEAGVDIFHCSQRRFWESEFPGSNLNLAGWAKKVTGKATVTVGSVGLNGDFFSWMRGETEATVSSLDNLVERLERGEFDLVAVGRALLGDPDWPFKLAGGHDRDIKAFDASLLRTLA